MRRGGLGRTDATHIRHTKRSKTTLLMQQGQCDSEPLPRPPLDTITASLSTVQNSLLMARANEPAQLAKGLSARSLLSLSLPLSPSFRSKSQRLESGSTTSSTNSSTTTTHHHADGGASGADMDATAAIERAVSSVLASASGENSRTASRIAIAPVRPTLDRDAIAGYMVLHAKKSKKKMFKLHRSSYFVIADANKPVLEVYNNESKSELVYLLSLAGAELGFESDDASHTVMAKCFCVTVKTWKKRDTVYLRPQGFVFFQEDQALMLVWVKCIHMAIKRAARSGEITDEQLFRCSNASTTAASEPPSGDDMEASGRERTTCQSHHDESEREAAGSGDDLAALGVVQAAAIAAAAAVALQSPAKARALGRRRTAAVEPLLSSFSPISKKSPSSRVAKPPQFPRFNSVIATIKSQGLASPTSSDGGRSRGPAATAAATATDKSLSPSFSPKLMSGLHIHRNKSTSSRQVAGVVTSPNASKRLSDPFQFRKKDTDGLFGGLTPSFFSPRGGPRSAPKQKQAKQPPPSQARGAAATQSVASGAKRSGAGAGVASVAAAETADPQAENNALLGNEPATTLEARLSIHLARLLFLLVSCGGGLYQLSLFLPVAAAGVFVHLHVQHTDEFPSAAIAACWVYAASGVEASLGLCSIAAILYGWSYADFRTNKRLHRNRIAAKLLEEETANFAHVEIPNWVLRPDVDRVEWLNKVLVTGWPYLKIAIRNSLMGCLNPLLESTRPAFMSSLSLVRVDLGSKTPIISGVKFVSANAKTEEVTLDIEVRIVSDESLLAELRMVSNLGAAAVVSLRDLFLVGTLRITLNPLLSDYWPCFSALSLSFTDRPVFDFTLTAAKINISNVPFASEWLHTFLHDLLMDYFVWPKVVHIPLWDETALTPPPPPTASC